MLSPKTATDMFSKFQKSYFTLENDPNDFKLLPRLVDVEYHLQIK